MRAERTEAAESKIYLSRENSKKSERTVLIKYLSL